MVGEASIDVNAGRGQLCYWMRVFVYPYDEWPPTGATIRQAPAGSKGPVRVDLTPQFGPLGDTTVSDCVSISKDLAHSIQKNPSQYYLLLTTEDYPDGAARAQFSK